MFLLSFYKLFRVEKCETLYCLQILESGSGIGWDAHSIFAVVLCLWMMHKLWEASAPQFSPVPNVCITIPLCSLRQRSLPSVCLCSTGHTHTHLVAVTKSRLKGAEGGGVWLSPHLCCWKSAPGKPPFAFSGTLWFLSSTHLAKERQI